MPDFATKLYVLRNQAGLSQTVCAEMLEVSRQTVSKWELGVSVPEVSKLVAISNLFSVSTDYLLKDDAETPVSGNLDRLVLRFLGYAQEMEEVSEQLVAMMRDGALDAEEREQVKIIMVKLREVSQVIDDIQLCLRENGIQ